MKLAILIINDRTHMGMEYLKGVLNTKYDFHFQTQDSIVHQSPDDEEEFLSFLGNGIEIGYEEDELKYISQSMASPCFYYVEFYMFSFFKEVVAFLNVSFEMMVDDDKGNIYNVPSFLQLKEW